MIFESVFMYGHCGTTQLLATGVKTVSTMEDRLKSAVEGQFTLPIHSKKKLQPLKKSTLIVAQILNTYKSSVSVH